MNNKRNKYITLFCAALVALLVGFAVYNPYRGESTSFLTKSDDGKNTNRAASIDKTQNDATALTTFDPKTIGQQFRNQKARSSQSPSAESSITDASENDDDEICGMTTAEAREFKANAQTTAGTQAKLAYAVLKPTVAQFVASSTLDEKITGLFMARQFSEHEALVEEWTSDANCNPLNHNSRHSVCNYKKPRATQERLNTPITALLALAESTGSIDAYAAAWYACRRERAEACKAVNAHSWARRDPTNFTAWLAAASESQRLADAAGLEAAMQGARAATTDNKRFPNLSHLLKATSPQSQAPHLHFFVSSELTAAQIAQYQIVGGVVNYCGLNSSVPQARGEICNAVLTKYLDNSRDFFSLTHILTLADRWGPNAERVKAIRDEQDAYHHLSVADRENPNILHANAGWSCKGMETQYQTAYNELKFGQLAYSKTLFSERKKTPAQVLEIVRKNQQ